MAAKKRSPLDEPSLAEVTNERLMQELDQVLSALEKRLYGYWLHDGAGQGSAIDAEAVVLAVRVNKRLSATHKATFLTQDALAGNAPGQWARIHATRHRGDEDDDDEETS
jgi:hypothetical protein